MWLINNSEKTIEICNLAEHKWYYFKPDVPVFMKEPLQAIEYKNRYHCLEECENPQDYFLNTPMKSMVIRDAGIGDLLLLEPLLRKYKQTGNVELSVLTRFPEVYENNPYIDHIFKTNNKESMGSVKSKDYDTWEDLRSYSETAPTRNKKHRTDVYNEKFNLEITEKEKEPHIYFNKKEKSLLKKKKGYKYIGISVDASHEHRKYPYEKELVEFIISQNKNNIVVLLGSPQKKDQYKHKQIIDLRNKTTIREMINYVRGLNRLIAVDSGIMHVALTLHIPTVCIFTIITPDFRMRYYTGKYKIITSNVDCIGCGDWHMKECRKDRMSTVVPCQKIKSELLYNELCNLDLDIPVIRTKEKIKINIIKSNKTITLPIIVQNEEKNLPRFIENVINHPSIGRVIAIDGGSTDSTIELLEKTGAEIYSHPYIKTYHEMQAMQRNISCSYVKEGENILIMDIDECFSKELSEYLPVLAESSQSYGLISRRTFNYYADIQDVKKQIKNYPDWQPRFYKWSRKFKFVGGAHHITLNTPEPFKIHKDILHFEKENKDRNLLEQQWKIMMNGVKKYA